ncbi:MAG: PIN domain-containing protein [Candidatus Methanoperedens sp.]|nr:PIN domain-containing protein [Candidatus Methanoperedens sp.]
MRETGSHGKNIQKFLVDTNLFIAAVKKWTHSTDLLVYLLTDPEIGLLANDVLICEYRKYALELDAMDFFEVIHSDVRIVNPSEESIIKCKLYFPETEAADAVHAATCMQFGAVLISNDKHFDKISEQGIIEVWKISEGIKKLL